MSGDGIAIVGMSCLFAGAPDLDTYWRNIVSKVDSISDPPADEWDPKMFYDPASRANDRVYCKRGGYIGSLASFRPQDFGVMPITVDGGEPDQWLALRVAHEALADAGYRDAPEEHERTEVILGKGTYVNRGNLTVGYHGMTVEYVLEVLRNLHPEYTEAEIQDIKQELKAGLPPFSADTAPALIGNIIAGRIANRLDLMGSSFTVDAACASALLAIEIGVRNLLSHKSDLVLAGGVNANAPLPTLSLFCQLGALSRREQIRPFDSNADGTILGEGLGMIVLKRLADAERDGNRVYACIKGVGMASDGRALHVMAPRVEGEELALRRAYEMAGFSADTVGLIEAHGTATPVGDLVEIEALGRVFGARKGTLPNCAVGSVKSMIGHTMPAAGIAGVIKTALALYHRVLPPSLHCEEPNPGLNLSRTPFYINTETRPWIHGAQTPRRAGVNSFGFGGINGHAVLEEHVPAAAPSLPSGYLPDWETEVCILEGESRDELLARCRELEEYLGRANQISLKNVAYSLHRRLKGGSARLAIVAAQPEELRQKLGRAQARLADPQCLQIKDNQGIYFFDRPFEGKLAFLFPGEGAQYPNMLLDLCLHFPEVRSCFDLADRALLRRGRTCLPSEFIFPRSLLAPAEQEEVDKALWQIDGAVEGVLVANWAMWTLLKQLQIRPDVLLGHSTGDYSAMFASHIIGLTGDDSFVETIVAWNEAHAKLATERDVPEVTLVAVAADSATVASIAEAVGGELYLAMDNCPHQNVLLGSKATVERAIEHLRSRGLMYEILPFDRPYHTPLFRTYAEGAGEVFFSGLPVSAPDCEVYSCTTAARYPPDPAKIREIFVDHWACPVRFTETIEAMYEDGVRLFVEAGPRGNLTAFVSDILRGKPHLAMPANVARRSGITQLNHLVGILAAQGVPMDLNYLYARRQPKEVAWEAPPRSPEASQKGAMKLSLAIPNLKVAPRPRSRAVPEPVRAAPETEPEVNGSYTLPPALPQQAVAAQVAAAPVAATNLAATPAPQAPVNGPALAMQHYVESMASFLEVEQKVMSAFLERARSTQPVPRTSSPAPAASAPAPDRYPLLGTVTSFRAGQELTAVRQLHPEEDLFLREHALGGAVSVIDPELRPLTVVPLTMTMELLAEAAAALQPGRVLVGMRNVQAHHWIRGGESPVDLHISARQSKQSPLEVEAEVRDGASPIAAAKGTFLFGSAYPAPPPISAKPFAGERTSRLANTRLYDGKLMFHGPVFQGVTALERSGEDGIVGRLEVLPRTNLFQSNPQPRFLTDPVVLDAAGQLVGFWAAEYLQEGFVVFPYRLDALRIFGPARPAGEKLTCRVQLQLVGNERIRSSLDIAAADGTLWMQFEGWEDRRFAPPAAFHRAWTSPQEAQISEPWPEPLAALPGGTAFECRRVGKLFESGGGLWPDLWSSLILTRKERPAFESRQDSEATRLQWLRGRSAAKDAVCSFLRKHHRMELLPADIEIAEDGTGALSAQGPWTDSLKDVPALAFAHRNGMAVAVAGGKRNWHSLGISLGSMQELPAGLETKETADDLILLEGLAAARQPEWRLRLWCAKQAIAQALARGESSHAPPVRIVSFEESTGLVTATISGALRTALEQVTASTALDGDTVTAVAIFERKIQ